jgi:hypothetical protein
MDENGVLWIAVRYVKDVDSVPYGEERLLYLAMIIYIPNVASAFLVLSTRKRSFPLRLSLRFFLRKLAWHSYHPGWVNTRGLERTKLAR